MAKLGTWPQERYTISWMTQRLANRAPEYTHARQSSTSVLQQVLNPIGQEMQRVSQQLTEERNNMFLSSCNVDLLSAISYLELGIGMEFQKDSYVDGTYLFKEPTVYGTLSETEYELTISQKNDIETLMYTALPSRIEDGETKYNYQEVIPRDTVANLAGLAPAAFPLPGHLFISIFNNTTWEYRGVEMIYYPKIHITGRTRKGTDITEAIPFLYNGTFKTINQWESVSDIFVSYMDDTAEIAVECLPFAQDSFIDVKNVIVPASGYENFKFVKLGDRVWGSSVISEGFSAETLSDIQLGFNSKETEYEIELLDSTGANINANALAIRDTSPYLYVIDDDNLYVYNPIMAFPDATALEAESTNTKMNLTSERWVYARDEEAVINTDTLDVSTVPWQHRWILKDPNGDEWYLGKDGSKWPLTTDAWIDNNKWDNGYWDEKRLTFVLDLVGTYILSIECRYAVDGAVDDNILVTRHLLNVPAIRPEQTLELPAALKASTDIMFDSDGKLWLKDSIDDIKLLNLFYDYYIVDYDGKAVWFREDYSEVRVVV